MKPFVETNIVDATHMKLGDHGFHGDVVLYCEDLPKDFSSMKQLKDNTLALGEATGHCHVLFGEDIDLREEPKTKEKYLKLVKPATLKHQEHNPVILPPGTYRIGIQKEYDHFEQESRNVAD